MRTSINLFILLGACVSLLSCSNYSYISENDVYMQAPTELNLEEDENDITTFNAYKARQKGVFDQEYKDPRVNERQRMNSFMMFSTYQPYGGRGFNNGPIGFHGMGMNPYGINNYGGVNYGFGYGMYGGNGFYNYYDPFAYGYPYNNYGFYGHGYNNGYYGNGYYGYGNGYYGNGWGGNGFNGDIAQGSGTTYKNVFVGQRRSPVSSSNRSSSSSKPNSQINSYVTKSYVPSAQKTGMNQSKVEMRRATGREYDIRSSNNRNISSAEVLRNNEVRPNTTRQTTRSTALSGKQTRSYAPNNSARNSGVVRPKTRSSATSSPSNRSVGTTRSSGSTRTAPTRTSPSPRIQSTQPSRGVSSRGSTSRPSSSRSSGSSSGRR